MAVSAGTPGLLVVCGLPALTVTTICGYQGQVMTNPSAETPFSGTWRDEDMADNTNTGAPCGGHDFHHTGQDYSKGGSEGEEVRYMMLHCRCCAETQEIVVVDRRPSTTRHRLSASDPPSKVAEWLSAHPVDPLTVDPLSDPVVILSLQERKLIVDALTLREGSKE